MLGIAAAVVIWLSLTAEHGAYDTGGQGPRAVVELAPAAKTAKTEGHGEADVKDGGINQPPHNGQSSAALTPPHAAAPHAAIPADASHGAPPDASHGAPPDATGPGKPANGTAAPTGQAPGTSQIVVAPIGNIMTERVPGQLLLPILEARQPLAPAPAPGLVQSSGLGSLPIISTDGRQPWKIYSRPFDRSNKMPRIALVITGLGLSSAATNIAIQSLPGAITLAFAPYAERLHEWVRLARTAGHEVMINVPMEPDNYPEYDPGPQTLLTSLSPQENVERLLWTLGRTTGYIGVVDFMGSRFTTSRPHLRPILKMLKKRGLMFLDSNSAARSLAPVIASDIGIPFAANSRFIDAKASRFAIDKQLELLEATAKKKTMAIGMGSPYPVTLERIANWVKEIKKRGYVLAPVSAMVKQTK